MKPNINKIILAVCACVIGTVVGITIFSKPKEKETETAKMVIQAPVEIRSSETDKGIPAPIIIAENTSDPNVLTDEEQASLKEIQEDMKAEKKRNTEKANGTGEYAEIVTSYDLAYAQQLAEETGSEMPDVTITMYALKNSNIRETPSTDAPILGQYNKGDEVKVSFIEDEWSKVELDDGKTGYVRNDLLANEKPSDNPPADMQADSSSDNTNTENAGNNETTGNADSTAGGDNATGGTTENPPAENPPADTAGGNASGGGAYTEEETQALRQQMLDAGATTGVDTTGVTGEAPVDFSKETSIDTSDWTLH